MSGWIGGAIVGFVDPDHGPCRDPYRRQSDLAQSGGEIEVPGLADRSHRDDLAQPSRFAKNPLGPIRRTEKQVLAGTGGLDHQHGISRADPLEQDLESPGPGRARLVRVREESEVNRPRR
jgi:hypothetical protein